MTAQTPRRSRVALPVGEWRVERIPGRDLYRTPEDRFVLPLWLQHDGEHVIDLPLRMTRSEAATFQALLTYLLDEQELPAGDPHALDALRIPR